MPIKVHRPPDIDHSDGPNIFLAGPIQGAPDWQSEAQFFIEESLPKSAGTVNVFNPRSLEMSHGKSAQIEWEKRGLAKARTYGALLFWFAARDFSQTDYPEGRAYAQTSRIEFGRAIGWKDLNPFIRIGIGIDLNYTGGNEDYITSCANEHALPIHRKLDQLCDHVVELGKRALA
jgi:hypothetical protein